MIKNLKIEEINITITNDPRIISGSERFKSTVNEVIQQGNGWRVIAFSKTSELSEPGLKKLRSLVSKLVWLKSEKTGNLREITKRVATSITQNKLWNE